MPIQKDYAPFLDRTEFYDFLSNNAASTWDYPIDVPAGFTDPGAQGISIGSTETFNRCKTITHYLQVTEPSPTGGQQVVANLTAREFELYLFRLDIKAVLYVSQACPPSIATAAVGAFNAFAPGTGVDPDQYFEQHLSQQAGAQREWFDVRCTFTAIKTGIETHSEELDAIKAFYAEQSEGTITVDKGGREEQIRESEYLASRRFRVSEIGRPVPEWGFQAKPIDQVHQQDTDGRQPEAIIDEISAKEAGALDCSDLELKSFKILSLLRFPEFKVIWRSYDVKVGCVWVHIPYPVLQIRWSDLLLYGYYRYPRDLGDIVLNVVEDCFWHAVLAGAVVGAALGNLPAAIAAFKGIFTECIKQQLRQLLTCMIPGLLLTTEANGDWDDI